MKRTILSLSIAGLILASCGGSDTKTEAPADATTEAPAAESAAPAETPNANVAEVTITGGDDMKFDLTEIKVKEGQTVKLTIAHTGTSPKTAMGHNWVLLAQGVNIEDYSNAAINAAATDYIPADKAKDVIVHTKLIGGGESDTIEFPAPAKGTYDFLCTFPGHHATMRGKFIVE
ncbi:MAG: azurin [Niabella sp.]|nr:MAG: azurin [Niabella sp.]